VPFEKLLARFPRTLANLRTAIQALSQVILYDNEVLNHPFKRVAEFENGKRLFLAKTPPSWLAGVL
jgi:predicted ABC-type ATPase